MRANQRPLGKNHETHQTQESGPAPDVAQEETEGAEEEVLRLHLLLKKAEYGGT